MNKLFRVFFLGILIANVIIGLPLFIISLFADGPAQPAHLTIAMLSFLVLGYELEWFLPDALIERHKRILVALNKLKTELEAAAKAEAAGDKAAS